MKLAVLITIVTILQATADTYAQRVTIKAKNISLAKVMDQVHEQTGYQVLLSGREEAKAKINVDIENVSLHEAMDNLLKGMSLHWTIKGQTIVIRPPSNAERNAGNRASPSQEREIRGRVVDESGNPLDGVTVSVKDTRLGTTTNNEGNFRVMVPENVDYLVFTTVGYETVEYRIGSSTSIEVTLHAAVSDLDEVVIVGFGVQRKVNLTGAVSTVSGDDLVNRPAVGTVDALQGVIPGATITRGSGSPGEEGFNVQIRGLTSVNSNPALVLIDGIEGNIDDVRPEDVESISVLKDAAAASIYGAKAAGGVILVTTKKGKSGRAVVEYSSYLSASRMGRLPKLLHSYEWIDMYNQAVTNAGAAPALTAEEMALLMDPEYLYDIDPANPNSFRYWGDYNYAELTLKTYSLQQSHNIAVSGGTENTTYRLSGTYFDNSGILKIGPDRNERYTGRFNIENRIGKYVTLSNVLSYSRNGLDKPAGNSTDDSTPFEGRNQFFSRIFQTPGVAPLFDPNGNWAYGSRVGAFDGRSKVAEGSYEAGGKTLSENNLRLNSSLRIDSVAPGLSFRLIGAIDANFDNWVYQRNQVREYGVDGTPAAAIYGANSLTKSTSNSMFKEFQFLTDYDLERGDHAFHVLTGYSFQDYRVASFSAQVNDLVNRNLPDFNWASNAGISLRDQIATNAFQSVFGRINYAFRGKYLVEANLRYDGSSKLNPNDRYMLFPSASGGWRLSEEPWFNIAAINELKFRGSWGRLGNAGVLGNYDYIPLLRVGDDLILSDSDAREQFVFQSQLASQTLTWETVESSNIGFDVTLLNGRLELTADYFTKRNKNMLARVAFPAEIGIGVPNLNAGELKTWGWEADITWKQRGGNGFNYWLRGNISDARNRLEQYLGADVINEGNVRLLNGYPVGTIWGYLTDHFFQTDEEVTAHAFQDNRTGAGDLKYLDLNGDNQVNPGSQRVDSPGDLVLLGDVNPRYSFGIQAGFDWKGFDAMVFFQGVGQRVFLMDQFSMMPFFREWLGPQRQHLDYWTPDNPDAFWPRLYARGDHNFRPSDKWLQDAAYIRLKDVQVGYTLPGKVINQVGIEKLRIYFTGRDVWEITKTFDYIDPEAPDGATFMYPFRRKFTVGINLTF